MEVYSLPCLKKKKKKKKIIYIYTKFSKNKNETLRKILNFTPV